MMKVKHFSYFALFPIFIFSCHNERSSPNVQAQLLFKKSVSIPITEEVALASIAKFCYVEIDGKKCFSLMDEAYKLIQLYDLENFSMLKEIRIQDSKYGSHHGSYMIHNLDTIFLLDYMNSKLYIINDEGVTKNVIDIRTEALLETEQQRGNPHVPYPMDAFNSNGFEYHDGKVFLTSSGMETVNYTKNLKEIFVIDLANDSVYLVMNKPSIYFDGYWGPHILHNFQFIYNENKNEFVVGHGVDNNVYTTDFISPSIAHPMRSKYLEKMKPYGKRKPSQYSKSPKIEKYSVTNGFYSRLYYDPYAHRYYRFVDKPVTSKDYNLSQLTGASTTRLSMIVTDENFENKFEIDLDTIRLCPAFICDDELYFIDKNAYNHNSDSLYFDIYQLDFQ